MGLVKKGLLWGLMSSTSILIGMSVVAILFGMYPKKFTATLKFNQQWVGDPLGWLLGLVPVVGDHLEAFVVSNGGGVALLVGEIAFVVKLIMFVVGSTFAARFLRRRSAAVANPNPLQPVSATQTNSGNGESVMHQVVVTFLAAVFAVAETLGIHLHYIMRVPTADINPTSYPFVWVATTVIALDIFFNLLSAAAGQSERKLWWLDLFTTLGRLFFVVGAWVATVLFWQGPVPASPRDVPIELWVLVGLTAWALLDLRLQWYKKRDVMAHVAVARAVHITPPAQAATIPAPTTTQPTSGVSGTAVFLLFVLLAALILGFVLWGDKGRYRTDVGSTGFGSYGSGWKTDIEPPPPLGHEWRDVTRR